MKKNITAQTILDTINTWDIVEIRELYKALYTLEIGQEKIDENAIDNAFNKWYNNDTKTTMLDSEVLEDYEKNYKKSIDIKK